MWTMDFVTGLPLDGGLNGLMVCIEKLTKLTQFDPLFCGGRGLNGALSCQSCFLLMLCNFLVYHARLSMIGTLALHLLSGSCYLPLWAPDCNLVVHSIHSPMDKLSTRTEPLNNCFDQWQLIRIASGFLVCHLWSLLWTVLSRIQPRRPLFSWFMGRMFGL